MAFLKAETCRNVTLSNALQHIVVMNVLFSSVDYLSERESHMKISSPQCCCGDGGGGGGVVVVMVVVVVLLW